MEGAVRFIPLSGLEGENLIERSKCESAWYTGDTFIEMIDTFKCPERLIDHPFRLSIVDFYKGGIGGSGSSSISGRIESGGCQVGEQVRVMPLMEFAIVKRIEIDGTLVKFAVCGDNVVLGISDIETSHLWYHLIQVMNDSFLIMNSVGFILCDPEYPLQVARRFTAQIVTFDLNVPLTIGVPVVFHHKSMTEPGFISKLISTIDKQTGKSVKENPRSLGKNMTASIQVTLNRPCCLELFSKNKSLGRFSLRVGSFTAAAGIGIIITIGFVS